MGTTQTDAADPGAPTALDVSEMPLSNLRRFVRHGDGYGPLHLERRGSRTYLVADGPS
jgi:hypothetical protein